MAENDLEDVMRRLSVIEDRIGAGQPVPLDRLSTSDLRIDTLQTLLQAMALTQNQMARSQTRLEAAQLEQGREMKAGFAAITTLLTTLIEQDGHESGSPSE